VNVLGCARDDHLQIFAVVLQPRVVEFVLELELEELGHLTGHRSGLRATVDLVGEVDDFLAIEENGLVRVV